MQETNEVSAREAAKRLGVGLSHLYQLLWAGKIPAQKRDGAWRISVEAIQARMRARSVTDAISSQTPHSSGMKGASE